MITLALPTSPDGTQVAVDLAAIAGYAEPKA